MMCDNYNNNNNALRWLFNLLVAVLLIQHVTHVVHATKEQHAGHTERQRPVNATISTTSLLVKRDVVGGINEEDTNLPTNRGTDSDTETDTDIDDELVSIGFDTHPYVNNGERQPKTVELQEKDVVGIGDKVDFSAYVNDFNMQDEASIPEDILDQQHIADADNMDTSIQYGETDVEDMALESQRPTSKNFSLVDDVVGTNKIGNTEIQQSNNNNNKKDKQYLDYYNSFKNKRKYLKNENKDKDDTDENTQDLSARKGILSKNKKATERDAAKQFSFMPEDDEEIMQQHDTGEEELDQQKQQQENQASKMQWQSGQSFEKINDKKFNKLAADFMDNNNNNNYDDGVHSQLIDKIAIGDIVESFHNEDGKASRNNKNIENVGNAENFQPPAATTTKVTTLIARKIKRHNGGAAAAIVALKNAAANERQRNLNEMHHWQQHHKKTYNIDEDSNEMQYQLEGEQQQQQQQQQKQPESQQQKQKHQAESSAIQQQPHIKTDKSINHFGILSNGSSINQVAAVNGDSAATTQHLQTKEIANDNDGVMALHIQKHYSVASTASPAVVSESQTTQSAFELHKAKRRYGHRTHKKKYKDYHRYALTPIPVIATKTPAETTPTAISAATTEAALAAIMLDYTNGQSANVANGNDANQAKNAGVNVVIVKGKLTNNSKDNYQQQQQQEYATRRAEKLRKYAKKLETEKLRGLPPPPIFAVGSRKDTENSNVASIAPEHPTKPFYEGQINYYVETKDGVDDKGNHNNPRGEYNMDRMIAAENSNWYRSVSPVLRNGIKTSSVVDGAKRQQQPYEQQQQRNNLRQQHHHHTHHRATAHRSHHKHHQHSKHHQSAHGKHATSQKRPYPPLTPIPPPAYKPYAKGAMQVLGHQITEMDELERYYAKWPHLARVQFQVYDEHYREAHPELYSDYDYENAAELELEEAQNDADNEDANLPPYIKKYNRRNKQLLNLLEGTLPPPTLPSVLRSWSGSMLQPGPRDRASAVRIDDDYLKEKRRRYHNSHNEKNGNTKNTNNNKNTQVDLFALQRSTTTPPIAATATTPTTAAVRATTKNAITQQENHFPDENLSISEDNTNYNYDVDDYSDADFWKKEMETKSNANEMRGSEKIKWQIEKFTTLAPPKATTSVPTTPKAALFKLPSYPAIAGSFIGKPRSRSAQFAPSSGGGSRSSRLNGFVNMGNYGNSYQSKYGNFISSPNSAKSIAQLKSDVKKNITAVSSTESAANTTTAASKALNSFVYHRVIDASPRVVGAGSTGRKQRLPFVAITDRRLETSKKALLHERQSQDFEQNHFPMP